jgi:hypothetical protein
MTDNRDVYKAVIFDGAIIESNGVSLCNLEDAMRGNSFIPRAKYQVWSDRHKFHELFFSIDEAVEKFLELKSRKNWN